MKIVKITRGNEEKDVYDIHVPGKEHYVANGIVSHNSALASQLCKFWASIGLKVVLVPLEMSKEEQTARVMANVANIDSRKILLKRLTEDEKTMVFRRFRRYAQKCSALGGRYTILKPEEDLGITELMPLASTYGPQVVIIDYISLLKDVDGDEQWRQLGKVARFCKSYADTNNLIVVLLAQVNEEGKLRYSQAVKEHSNNCWIFVSTKETLENRIINIEQVKARNGERFPFSLRANLDTMRIGDLDKSSADLPAPKSSKNSRPQDKPAKSRRYMEDLSEEE